jgi:hypothetical protein
MLFLTVGLVVVVAAVAVLLRVAGGGDDDSGAVAADVSGTPSPQRADLSPLPVDVPPPAPEVDAPCSSLMAKMPLQLAGEQSRPVSSDSPYVYAWGDPALVLVCGAGRPAGFDVTAGLLQIGAVQWFVDDSDPDVYVWTAVDRPVYVQLTVPSSMDSAAATQLSAIVAETLPAQEPQPAG